MNKESLVYKLYSVLQRDADTGNSYNNLNWAYHIKSILNGLGFPNLWHNQDALEGAYNQIKLRIWDQYKQTWCANLNNSSRLSIYSRYKHIFCQDQYLHIISQPKYRIALTKFRISAHDLEIERGRHVNIDRADRICSYCNQNAIESEFHFLLVCTHYSDLRRKYLPAYFCNWPTLNKFDMLMSSTSKQITRGLSKYILYGFGRGNIIV